VPVEGALDLAELDPVAAPLDLRVPAAQEEIVAVLGLSEKK